MSESARAVHLREAIESHREMITALERELETELTASNVPPSAEDILRGVALVVDAEYDPSAEDIFTSNTATGVVDHPDTPILTQRGGFVEVRDGRVYVWFDAYELGAEGRIALLRRIAEPAMIVVRTETAVKALLTEVEERNALLERLRALTC